MTEESSSFVVANTCATSASHWPSREKRKPRYLNGDVGASLASACLLIVMLDVSGSVLLPKSQAEISDFVTFRRIPDQLQNVSTTSSRVDMF